VSPRKRIPAPGGRSSRRRTSATSPCHILVCGHPHGPPDDPPFPGNRPIALWWRGRPRVRVIVPTDAIAVARIAKPEAPGRAGVDCALSAKVVWHRVASGHDRRGIRCPEHHAALRRRRRAQASTLASSGRSAPCASRSFTTDRVPPARVPALLEDGHAGEEEIGAGRGRSARI